MNHDAVEAGMLWVGVMLVFTPVVFAGIVLGVWWYKRKQERLAQQSPAAPAAREC